MGSAPGYHTWNYRIVEDEHGGLAIHEVHYDDARVVTEWSVNGIAPYGETMQELNTDFNMMQEAFYEPVLKFVYSDEDGMGLKFHPANYTPRKEVEHDSSD